MVRIVKKAAQRRDEIVDTACQLFLTKGYDKTTMSDVMHSLQVAKGTIYHYFKSKEELLDAVVENIVAGGFIKKQTVVQSCKGLAMEKLILLITSSKKNAEHREFLDNLHQPSNAGMHIRLLARLITVEAPLYAELIQQGCKEGIFSTDYPLECAEFILAGVQFITDLGVYPWNEEQLLRRAQALPRLIETQLQAPIGSFQFLLDLLH